jgi:hypothetical protein
MRTAASTIVRDDARHNQGLVTASPVPPDLCR